MEEILSRFTFFDFRSAKV